MSENAIFTHLTNQTVASNRSVCAPTHGRSDDFLQSHHYLIPSQKVAAMDGLRWGHYYVSSVVLQVVVTA
ncbi:MAG: hypothetical protein Q9M13_00985 [Mariprofundales bacterium]|nr:hypothetical protein [Mariprofundales bacterium]